MNTGFDIIVYLPVAERREQDRQSRARECRLIAGAEDGKTADEVADTLLNEIIKTKYPQVLEIEKQIAGIEKDLADILRKDKVKGTPLEN
jgi:hypothetical protein